MKKITRMIKQLKLIFFKNFSKIDAILKFPNLKQGEIAIQVGFDMTSAVTSDLFELYQRVTPKGTVIGIDPDPRNHVIANEIIIKNKLNITTIQKGTFSEKGQTNLLLGKISSWNQLDNIPIDTSADYEEKEIIVDIDTIDNIVKDLNLDIEKISHINLTCNGAEYNTLLGAKNLLENAKNISLTIIAGRYDESGTLGGKPDYELILKFLEDLKFNTKFKRMHQFFWWGFIVRTLINRDWIYNKNNYGLIMAYKGRKKTKWYQSFS